MWGRNRVRPETIDVSGDGLWRITEELYDYQIMSLAGSDVWLKVTPLRTEGYFRVHLTSDQTRTLLAKLPRLTLQDEYGEDVTA